jgi:ParB family chromosome partitioning protein
LQIAQVEIAKHPIIALDLLVFQAASTMLGSTAAGDGADVQFKRPRLTPTSGTETTAAGDAFATIAKALCVDWLKPQSEADRFEAFRLLPEPAKLDLLAYCVASTLKPKLGAAVGDEVTAYDAVLAITEASVATYWRPTKDNFLGRVSRSQLLAIGREVLGEAWSQSRASDKKASLVDQLDRAFSNPGKSIRKPEQVEKLKSWLPTGMSFDIAADLKPAKAGKARKAA